ncbi:MAG: hypothetical protein P8Y36_14265 [Alphaproteobacteria bacterium]
MNIKKYIVWSGLFFLLTFAAATAEEVKIDQQGLDAFGNLEIARGKSLKKDGVVLLLHDTHGHNRMEIMSALQELLTERGINSLAVTLTLGMNERRGMFDCSIEQDHRNEDALEEIRNWVEWLKEKGATKIILAGHGRGGNQVAIYAKNVNYYGSNQNLYTPSLMPFLKMPVLVMVGELDPLATELKPAIEGIPDARNVTMETIPGADRYFRDLAAEEVANRIRDFLKKPSTSKRVDNSTTDRP